MDRIQKILVASDHSERARHAESRAAILGRELNASAVEVMNFPSRTTGETRHASMPAPLRPASISSAAIDGPALDVPPPLGRESGQRRPPLPGAVPAAIVEHAVRIGADLTVAAGRRESFLAGIITRFRIDELIRLSDRPVLLVNRKPEAPYRKILVAVDFSAEALHAAKLALSIAPAAQFTFLHVFRVPELEMMSAHGVTPDNADLYHARAKESARASLNRFIGELGPRKQLIYRAIEYGAPAPVIHAHAQEINADLIAVGKHGKSRFLDLFLGSVTQRLIDYSDRDLLVTTLPDVNRPGMPPAA